MNVGTAPAIGVEVAWGTRADVALRSDPDDGTAIGLADNKKAEIAGVSTVVPVSLGRGTPKEPGRVGLMSGGGAHLPWKKKREEHETNWVEDGEGSTIRRITRL